MTSVKVNTKMILKKGVCILNLCFKIALVKYFLLGIISQCPNKVSSKLLGNYLLKIDILFIL